MEVCSYAGSWQWISELTQLLQLWRLVLCWVRATVVSCFCWLFVSCCVDSFPFKFSDERIVLGDVIQRLLEGVAKKTVPAGDQKAVFGMIDGRDHRIYRQWQKLL